MVDALMITYGRLEYTKVALAYLLRDDEIENFYVIDNGSIDGTIEWLKEKRDEGLITLCLNKRNSIASAMNNFLELSKAEYCIKVDNDTIIPHEFCARMLPHMKYADMVQAKHPIIKASNPGGWEAFTKNMKRENGLLYNHFIGGSGIMFKRDKVKEIPETENPIMGWRQWQREHPEVKKAFCEDVEIELLDAHGYEDYPDYYKQTGRIC